jgi:hypothetical protein
MKSSILVFLFIAFGHAHAQRPPPCYMKSYNYTGTYHSDSYAMPEMNGLQSCHDRKTIDVEALGKFHKTNRELIDLQIENMLIDPSCKDVHEVLNQYRMKLKKQKEQTEQKFKVASDYLETIKSLVDIQRTFAYGAAYNTACSAERNGESTFIDLDTINKILPPSTAQTTQVVKTDEKVGDCSDVKAHGDNDLREFKVSMKKAKGTDFKFFFDPYGIPDQVILKDSGGAVLYDSGCKGSSGNEDLNVKIPLSKLNGEKEVVVSIVNNCSDPTKIKGVSAWELSLQCVQEEAELCVKPKNDLVGMLKREIDFYKRFLDANAMERHCFIHFDENILKEMESYGLFIHEGGVKTNGICETMDEECEARQHENARNEQVARTGQGSIGRLASLDIPKETSHCPDRPKMSESVLKVISWNYCKLGRKKLGLE